MKYTNKSNTICSFFGFMMLILTFNACSSQKVTPLEDLPDWAKGTPNNPEYYMGVGHAFVTPYSITFKDKAKNKALQELAQAISYRVKSTSIMINDSHNDEVNTTFSNIVRLNIETNLQGYEIAETFENEIDYYVLYRLSKTKYAQQIEEKKQKAILQATTKFEAAKSFEKQYNYYQAIIKYAQVINDLKDYYAENPVIKLQGVDYVGIDYSFKQIQTILQRLQLKPLKSKITTRFGSTIQEFGALLKADNIPIENFPISAHFSAPHTPDLNSTTHTNGKVYFNNLMITSQQKEENITYKLALNQILKEAKVDFNIRQWLLKLEIPQAQTTLNIASARIYYTTTQNIDNKIVQSNSINTEIVKLFEARGFLEVKNKQKADYYIELTGNSQRLNTQNGTYTSVLSGFFIVRNASRNICYKKQFNNIKGRQLSYYKAGQNAYGQLIQQINNDWIETIIQSMLKH